MFCSHVGILSTRAHEERHVSIGAHKANVHEPLVIETRSFELAYEKHMTHRLSKPIAFIIYYFRTD